MTDGNFLINLSELSKPMTVLIEKISGVVWGISEPWQIKRVAKATAEANFILAEGNLKISE